MVTVKKEQGDEGEERQTAGLNRLCVGWIKKLNLSLVAFRCLPPGD